jgi:hypothetical protein
LTSKVVAPPPTYNYVPGAIIKLKMDVMATSKPDAGRYAQLKTQLKQLKHEYMELLKERERLKDKLKT